MNRAPFLKQVAADLLARHPDGLTDVAVVFTNKRPVVFLRKYLAELAGKPIWSPACFTIQEFLRQSAAVPEASPLTQFFILHQAHNELLREEGRPELPPDEFHPLAEIILSDFAQLDYDLVGPDEVYAELRDIALLQQRFPHLSAEQQRFMRQFWESFSPGKQTAIQQKFLQLWIRLPRLYERFDVLLRAQQLTTMPRIYRDLATGGAEKPDFADAYKQLAFVGFNALNRCEAKLFTQWQAAGNALFYADADRYYTDDDQQEAGLFLRRNARQYGLVNALGDFPETLARKANAVELLATSGKTAQAKALARLLAQRPPADGTPTGTAIILADESLLIPVLQSIPEHVAFNVTMGYPLAQSSLFGYIDGWLGIQQQLAANNGRAVHHLDVESAISHPLAGIATEEREALQAQIAKNEWLEVPTEALRLQTGSHPDFFERRDSDGLLGALHALLDGVLAHRQQNRSLRHIEASLILAVKKTLNGLQDGLEHHADLAMPFVCALVRKALMGISAPIEGEPLSGIQIMGLLESRCLDFDHVYILGANEGALPKITAAPSFIPDSIRRAHGLPVLENQDALSAYLFYRLLQHPSRINLVYNAVVDETNTGEISRFVRQLAFESGWTFQRTRQGQQVKAATAAPALVVPKTGAVWQALLRYFDTGQPDRPRLSASALTTYLQSPLLFFLKYVAGIKEPPRISEEFELNQLGTVVHGAMQAAYERLQAAAGGDPITPQAIRQQVKALPQLCVDALSVALYKAPGQLKKPNSLQRILLKIAEEYAAVFLSHDALHVAPLRIVELENDTDYVHDFPIMVGGQTRSIQLYGIIDRVDEVNGKTRIVDYKTGRDEVKFSNLETLLAPASGKSNKAMIQTLFYTFVYERKTGKRGVEPNLYIARKLRTEGPLFYMAGRGGRSLVEGEALEDIKQRFEEFLRQTLEELFNPEIPFGHNPEAVLYPGEAYLEFLAQALPDADDR